MSNAHLRPVALARRSIGEKVGGVVTRLERSSHVAALDASRCVTACLEAHAEALLSPLAGASLIRKMDEAMTLATGLREKAAEIHVLAVQVAQENGIAYATYPDCPPNTGGNG